MKSIVFKQDVEVLDSLLSEARLYKEKLNDLHNKLYFIENQVKKIIGIRAEDTYARDWVNDYINGPIEPSKLSANNLLKDIGLHFDI